MILKRKHPLVLVSVGLVLLSTGLVLHGLAPTGLQGGLREGLTGLIMGVGLGLELLGMVAIARVRRHG